MVNIISVWRDIMDNQSDYRTRNWFLMSSPFPTIMICMGYAYVVKVLGPRLMENRKPFKLRKTLIVYNLLQAMLSFYLFSEAAIAWFGRYNWRCQNIDLSEDEYTMRMVRGSYVFYISKYFELFDTFFFILRKRYDQVSFLHVIHHGIMPFSVWWGVKFMPGGHSTFFAFLNTFVHVIMYTYYMIAAIGPEMQKFLWWKKYLTIIQMIQFILVVIHSFQLIFYNPCNVSMSLVYFIAGHAIFFLVLFANFYRHAYSKDNLKSRKIKAK